MNREAPGYFGVTPWERDSQTAGRRSHSKRRAGQSRPAPGCARDTVTRSPTRPALACSDRVSIVNGRLGSCALPVGETQSAAFRNVQELKGRSIPRPRLGMDESHAPQLADLKERQKYPKPP